MPAATIRHEVSLPPRGVFEIADASGLQLACTSGSLWVTLDHDPRDIILEPGETFVGTEHTRALVYAFGAAVLEVRERVDEPHVSPFFAPPGRTIAFA